MKRPSPTASPTASDDEGENGLPDGAADGEAEGEIQLDVMDCVDGLVEFATQAGTEWDNTIEEGDI